MKEVLLVKLQKKKKSYLKGRKEKELLARVTEFDLLQVSFVSPSPFEETSFRRRNTIRNLVGDLFYCKEKATFPQISHRRVEPWNEG